LGFCNYIVLDLCHIPDAPLPSGDLLRASLLDNSFPVFTYRIVQPGAPEKKPDRRAKEWQQVSHTDP
jgi:hypothetical protein